MVQDQRAAKLCSNELPVTDSTCLEFGEKVCHITIVIMPGNPQLHDHQLCQIQSFFYPRSVSKPVLSQAEKVSCWSETALECRQRCKAATKSDPQSPREMSVKLTITD